MEPITVVETAVFRREAARLFTGREIDPLTAYLAIYPMAGDVVPQSGGVRKLRWAAKGKGRRGGARIIYFFFNDEFPVLLLSAYSKGEKDNLTATERQGYRKQAATLVTQFRRKK